MSTNNPSYVSFSNELGFEVNIVSCSSSLNNLIEMTIDISNYTNYKYIYISVRPYSSGKTLNVKYEFYK